MKKDQSLSNSNDEAKNHYESFHEYKCAVLGKAQFKVWPAGSAATARDLKV